MRTGKGKSLHPIMPWTAYSGMSDEDLRAIYAYLRTLPPVSHVVANGPNPAPCRKCGQRRRIRKRAALNRWGANQSPRSEQRGHR